LLNTSFLATAGFFGAAIHPPGGSEQALALAALVALAAAIFLGVFLSGRYLVRRSQHSRRARAALYAVLTFGGGMLLLAVAGVLEESRWAACDVRMGSGAPECGLEQPTMVGSVTH